MTQDETSSEVFLGPTGSETEEFYCYQRTNPGLEKTEYLEWFQNKFRKEIELRRRRSDQPSDIEFMVIKKRSKYRERIGEESAELCRYSEEHPTKTYRELAEWFQERFGKEIDITAISRALKRGREAIESGTPQPDTTPPPSAKRGRRSLNSAGPSLGEQQGMSTFTVDMPGNHSNPISRQPTPNCTPGQTPKIGSENLSSPDENSGQIHHFRPNKNGPPPPPPPTLAPHTETSHSQPSLPKLSFQPPYPGPPPPSDHHAFDQSNTWPSVNGGQSKNSFGSPRIDVRASPRTQKPTSSNTHKESKRALRSKAASRPQSPKQKQHVQPHSAQLSPQQQLQTPQTRQQKQHSPAPLPVISPAPLQPRQNYISLPNTPSASSTVSQIAPRQYPSHQDLTSQLQSRLNTAVEKHSRSIDEIRACHTEIATIMNERSDVDQRIHEEHANMLVERDRLRDDLQRMRTWGEDIQRGNLELQGFERGYRDYKERLIRADEYNSYLQNSVISKLEANVRERDAELEKVRKVLDVNGLDVTGHRKTSFGAGNRKSKTELDDWVQDRFATESKHEGKLRELVDGVESAGWKDLPGKLQMLKMYLQDMHQERESKQSDWKRFISLVYPVNCDDEAGEDADDEGDGNHITIKEDVKTPVSMKENTDDMNVNINNANEDALPSEQILSVTATVGDDVGKVAADEMDVDG